MPDSETIFIEGGVRPARPRRGLQLFGIALLAYGIVGIVLFVGAAVALTRPLDRLQRLSESLEVQRDALVASLDQAEATIDAMAGGVVGVDESLAAVQGSIDRAAQIANGVSASMYELRDASGVSILGQQPLAGLSGAFDTAGAQLALLSEDLAGIGGALEGNRGDVVATAATLTELADSVGDLSAAVGAGPGVDVSPRTIANLRLAIYVLCGWMAGLGVLSVIGGAYLVRAGRG